MRRAILVVLSLVLFAGVAYASVNKWAIRHDTMQLYDASRHRPVTVNLAVRRDIEMRANAGMMTMPVAIINHGYTVRSSEYSFIANVLATRGYLVASIQHDLPTDAPLSQTGSLYVGRMPMYERGMANILFAIQELKKVEPHADYGKLTLLGHSNGGDISMFFAGRHPDMVTRVVTLDNLRVPFLMNGRQQILSLRSKDWKPDAGVVPSDKLCDEAGIEVVQTDAQHTEMSDRGPANVKQKIVGALEKFLNKTDNAPAVVRLKPDHDRPGIMYSTVTP
jgi:pimeloyl-ACP methyl ester carboxylesterase